MRAPRTAKAVGALCLAAVLSIVVPSSAQAATIGKSGRTIYLARVSTGSFSVPYNTPGYWDVPADGWYMWSNSPYTVGSDRQIYLAADTYEVSCQFWGTGVDWLTGPNYEGFCSMTRGSNGAEARLPYSGTMQFELPGGTEEFYTQLTTL